MEEENAQNLQKAQSCKMSIKNVGGFFLVFVVVVVVL